MRGEYKNKIYVKILFVSIFFVYLLNILGSSYSVNIHASGSTNLTCADLAYGVKNGKSQNGNITFTNIVKNLKSGGYVDLKTYNQVPTFGQAANGQKCSENGTQISLSNNSNFQKIPSGSVIYYYQISGPSIICPGCETYEVYYPTISISSHNTIQKQPIPTIGDIFGSNHSFSISTMLSIFLPIIYGLVGIIVLALVSYAGFLVMTSQGDSNKLSKAKSVLTGALIGASIILLAYIISLVLLHTV